MKHIPEPVQLTVDYLGTPEGNKFLEASLTPDMINLVFGNYICKYYALHGHEKAFDAFKMAVRANLIGMTGQMAMDGILDRKECNQKLFEFTDFIVQDFDNSLREFFMIIRDKIESEEEI